MMILFGFVLNILSASATPLEDYYNQNFVKETHGFQMEKLLTDDEQKLSKDYVSQEFMDLSKSEACKELAADSQKDHKRKADDGGIFTSDRYKKKLESSGVNPCDPNSVDQNVFVIDPTIDKLVPVIGQVYTMFFGVGGSEIKTGKPGSKDEKSKDYCSFIPGATELASQAMQQASQQPVQDSTQNVDPAIAQSESFFQLARVHEIRKKTARVQEIGWGAASACYVGYIAAGMVNGAAADVGAYLKLAGTATVATFYGIKAARHQKWADALRAKGQQLRDYLGSHNCDPIKEKHCYCSMTSTKNDPTYCLPKKRENLAQNKEGGPCITIGMQTDPNCNCIATKSCFDYQLAADMGSLNFGNNFLKGSLADVNKISSAGFESGALSGGDSSGLAMAKNFMKNNKAPADIFKINLNDKQKEKARNLTGIGLPLLHAAALAGMPDSAAGRGFASTIRESFGGNSALKNKAPEQEIKSSNLQFSQPKSAKKGGGSDDDENPFAPKTAKENGGSNQNLNFAIKAQREAEISKRPETPIFEIITHRYKASAWKKFDIMDQPNSK